MRSTAAVFRFLGLFTFLGLAGCACGDDDGGDGGRFEPDTGPGRADGGFICNAVGDEACEGDTHITCVMDGEFVAAEREDCRAMDQICVRDLWCVVCRPGTVSCQGDNAVRCLDDGSGWEVIEECDIGMGFACRDGMCVNLCDEALRERSYVGCEFYAADLDNAAIAVGRDA